MAQSNTMPASADKLKIESVKSKSPHLSCSGCG
jgi:hypothetical protein